MRLFLEGHDYKYATEQIMLTMFPEERPTYVERRGDIGPCGAAVTLKQGEKFITATTVLHYNGKKAVGAARIAAASFSGKLERDSQLNHLVKRSFYKAAVAVTGKTPAWGSLTGIRPAKIVTRVLEQGGTKKQADKLLKERFFVAPERRKLCIDSAQASLKLKREVTVDDISLYVGIPFCPTRCAYCSFVSNSVEKSMKMVQPYLEALYGEIEDAGRRVKELGLRIKTVYFGGGTPTTLTGDQLDALMEKLRCEFDLDEVEEYTVEAGRPDTVDFEKFRTLKKNGVTRVSINPQTMRDDVLDIIGRSHSSDDIIRAYDQARDAGLDNINMDLIAGLPGDDEVGFAASLDKVMALEPENITVHTLALKKGSRLRLEGRGDVPGEDSVERMLEYSRQRLTGAGYDAYYLYRQKFMAGSFENVGWSKPGFECLYNIYIMEELHTILSLGAGGTTKLVDPNTTRIERIFNPKYPHEYMERLPNIIKSKDYMHEYYGMMKGK